jgi:hypothetical protein
MYRHYLQPWKRRYARSYRRVPLNASYTRRNRPHSYNDNPGAPTHTPARPQSPPSSFPISLPLPHHGHLRQCRLLQRPPKRRLKPRRVLRRLPLPWRQLPTHLTAHNNGVQPKTCHYMRSYGCVHLNVSYVRRSSSTSPTVSNDEPGASPNYPVAPCLPPLPPLCTMSRIPRPTRRTRLPRHH